MADTGKPVRASGRCLCSGVTYEVTGPMRPAVACHCTECRRFTGSIWNATAARRKDLTITDDGCLKWYRSSDWAQRGFCGNCGSSLFMDIEGRDYMVITAGTMDLPTGLELAVHIYTDEAGDYYQLHDGLPKIADTSHNLTFPDE